MSQVHANVFSGFKHATPVAVLVQAVRLVLAVIEYDDADRYFVTDRRPKRLVAEIQRAITGQTPHFLIGITDLDADRGRQTSTQHTGHRVEIAPPLIEWPRMIEGQVLAYESIACHDFADELVLRRLSSSSTAAEVDLMLAIAAISTG